MKLEKVTNIILGVIMAVSVLLIVMLTMNISDDMTDATMNSWINANLNWTYTLLGAATFIAVVFALIQTVTDKNAAKSGGIALACAVVIIGAAYALASDAIPNFHGVQDLVAEGSLTNAISKWVGTTLYTTYILLGLIIASIVGFGVKSIFASKN
ncbi:MAG: hypothetical protein ACK5LR_04335 [Mangrovibacterium sp.]